MKRGEDENFTLTNIDAIVFKICKLEPVHTQFQYAASDIAVTPPSHLLSDYAPTNNHKTFTPTESFKRDIKRDYAFYNSLKKETWVQLEKASSSNN